MTKQAQSTPAFTAPHVDRRPASMHDAISRASRLLGQVGDKKTLSPEALDEAQLLAGWIDLEGTARRIRVLVAMGVEEVANLPGVTDATFAPLVSALDLLDQLAEAAFMVENLQHHLHQHELVEQAAI